MFIKLSCATTVGVNAHLVEVEVDLSLGILQFNIVGLPDAAIKESRQRIATALKNCGVKLPERKITVNLAPADLKKEGTLFDLPIALAIICASQHVNLDPHWLSETLFLGELSLDGSIKPVKGVLPIVCDMASLGKKRIFVPAANAVEAAVVPGIEVFAVDHFTTVIGYLRKEIPLQPVSPQALEMQLDQELNFSQVKGQFQAKRALQIAAAGKHNILFIGSPGSGKTMLAQRLASIMPPMEFDEIIEASKIYSISGKLVGSALITQRPFRAPHHTISTAGLAGGGSHPQPGEMSLAHHGILFLDELTEFKRTTIEALRQPLENQTVSIARVQQSVTFPASFLLVAALNPCPCGFLGDKKRTCTCSQLAIQKYLTKLSGPLLDRIDLHVKIPSIDYQTLTSLPATQSLSSQDLYSKIVIALQRQQARFNNKLRRNGSLTPQEIDEFCTLTPQAQELMKKAFDKLQLSMRGYHKILKIARTIADLENCDIIDHTHMQEAIMYRSLDRTLETIKV